MLELDRFKHILKLSLLFSVFLYGLSWILTLFFINLGDLLKETFLNSLVNSVNLIFLILLKIITFTLTVYMIIAIPTILFIFFYELYEGFKKL
jgi:hypothetical protein